MIKYYILEIQSLYIKVPYTLNTVFGILMYRILEYSLYIHLRLNNEYLLTQVKYIIHNRLDISNIHNILYPIMHMSFYGIFNSG